MGIPAYEGVGFAGIWTEKIENERGNHIRFASRWNKARKMSEKQIRKLRMKRVVNFNFQFYLFFICCFRIFPEKSGKRNLSFTLGAQRLSEMTVPQMKDLIQNCSL